VARAHAFAAAALGAASLAAAPAPAAAKSKLLSRAQVLKIALRVARVEGDAHPTRIELASGRLKAAIKVFDPHAHPTSAGLKALGGGKSTADVVAMHGRFTSTRPRPHNARAPKGKVLELIFSAHSGTVFALSLGPKVPVPLSRLGHVTRLR
jgi:hypothetical protein